MESLKQVIEKLKNLEKENQELRESVGSQKELLDTFQTLITEVSRTILDYNNKFVEQENVNQQTFSLIKQAIESITNLNKIVTAEDYDENEEIDEDDYDF